MKRALLMSIADSNCRRPIGLLGAMFYLWVSLSAMAQSFSPTPVAGDKTVTVNTETIAAGTQIHLFTASTSAACNATATSVPVAPYTNSAVLAGSNTTLTLAAPLVQNQILCGIAGTSLISAASVGAPTVPPGFDWGLVRAYFTFGGLLSEADSQFSHSDLFMSFHLDKTYRQLSDINDTDSHSYRPGLNSFFDVRLTALPVAVQPCAASSTTPSSSSSNCASSSTSSSSSGSSTPSTQVFLNSQKSARLQFGTYTPFVLNRWHMDSRAGAAKTPTPTYYALYFAPLAKTGFDTSINGLNQTQQSSATPTLVQPVGSSSSFYKFYDFGFRLGHYQLTNDKDTAPDILSFLDVTWGRFSNMASLLCPAAAFSAPNGCNVPSGTTLPWTHDWRLNAEGLLEVPASKGFSIGFSANVSQPTTRTTLNGTTLIHIRPQDDLRFLFAYRFDISTIAAKLAPQ